MHGDFSFEVFEKSTLQTMQYFGTISKPTSEAVMIHLKINLKKMKKKMDIAIQIWYISKAPLWCE